MDDLYKINPSIHEKYRLEPDFWDKPYKTVNIKSKNKHNNNIYLENNQKGNCWIIKNDNLFLLIPRKKYRGKKNFNKQEYFEFELLFKLEGYKQEQTRDFILQEPAEVSLHGKDWRLDKKGILNFDTSFLSSLSVIELQGHNIHNSPDNQENKELKEKIATLEKQLESCKKEILKEVSDRIPPQTNIDLDSFKQEILHEICDRDIKFDNKLESLKEKLLGETSDRTSQKPSINLQSFKQEIIKEIGDRTSQKSNPDLEAFKRETINKIDEREQKLDNKLKALKQEILDKIGNPIPQQPNINLRYFKEKILNEISDLDQKFDNKLDSLKQGILSQISDRIPQQQNIDLETFKQEILDEVRELDIKFDNKLESFKEKLLDEISDRDIKFDNKLESLKEKLLDEIGDRTSQKSNPDLEAFKQEIINEISDRIPQQPDINLESLKKLIRTEIRESKQKKKSNLEYSHEPISLKELQSLIKSYNSNPGLLASKSTMVAATRESIEQRRTGYNTPIIFTQTDNDSYWIIYKKLLVEDDYFYLVPKANLIINSRIYQTIEDIFVCQNYSNRSSNKFQLGQPAIVKLTADSEDSEEKWELVEPGKLNFF
ncbi:MAG: hypothetical protein QNJ55_31630 [Xenococcus sp. MO_188.B8]|nr:hypothetical protein [Xenococcus sp. MO_188.B8]